jgi:hypothetical protein
MDHSPRVEALRRISTGPRRLRRAAFAAAGVTLLASAAVWASTGSASAATVNATVSVNASQSIATVPETLVGANFAIWDGLLSDSRTATLMKDAGVRYLRYPGGSYADSYHWKTHTMDGGGYVAPGTNFDTFMGVANAAGAKPIIIANYGSGTAQEAADWVRYANVTKGYGAKYWEIGNEVYGNGHYGSGWENDTHADKSPRAYGNAVVQYITAMKAVDPSIKVGVVLTTPGGWPDGVVGSGDSADWNNTVMSIVGNRADFAIPHWYPGGNGEADMLSKPQQLGATMASLRSVLNKYGATNAQIFITETNGAPPRNTQPQALFAADMYLTAAEVGVANADWWNVHNGSGSTAKDSTGATDYLDEGMISNGSGSEPAAQTPFKPYYGIQMVNRVSAPGDTLVRASSNQSKLITHAVRRSNGGLDVLLINKDNANSYAVNLSYTGYTPTSAVTVDTLGVTSTSITSGSSGTATSQTIAPYSLLAVHLKPSNGTPPVTTPATTPPRTTPPVTTPPGTTPPVTTPPVTTPPATGGGSCAVTYKADSWATGFVGNVTITNRASTPLNGWTLRWSFAGNQQVSSAWNATVTQTGQQVTAGNAAWNASVPANGTASFGFQATYSGTNATPNAFTLNGTACSIQ